MTAQAHLEAVREALEETCALADTQGGDEAFESLAAQATQALASVSSLAAELERLESEALKYGGAQWMGRARVAIRERDVAIRERDEAKCALAKFEADAGHTARILNDAVTRTFEAEDARIARLETALSVGVRQAETARKALEDLRANAVLEQDSFDENVAVRIPIAAWRDSRAALASSSSPACDEIPAIPGWQDAWDEMLNSSSSPPESETREWKGAGTKHSARTLASPSPPEGKET